MSIQQLQLPLTTIAPRARAPGEFKQCNASVLAVAISLCKRKDGVTIDELRAECIALGIKPSPLIWWATALRGHFVLTDRSRGMATVWRLA